MSVYDINGMPVSVQGEPGTAVDYDKYLKSINHRGYRSVAPDNTIPAFILSKKMGFNYVESDLRFTQDGVAVMLHDTTIDATSNGSGAIANMTYETAAQYDFGSWKSSDYAGTKIPTFEEFIMLCKDIGLHPYIEIKAGTAEQLAGAVEIVRNSGMINRVTWCGTITSLQAILLVDPTARIDYFVNALTEDIVADAIELKTEKNTVVIGTGLTNDSALVQRALENGLELECGLVYSVDQALALDPGMTGAMADKLHAGMIRYQHGLGESVT